MVVYTSRYSLTAGHYPCTHHHPPTPHYTYVSTMLNGRQFCCPGCWCRDGWTKWSSSSQPSSAVPRSRITSNATTSSSSAIHRHSVIQWPLHVVESPRTCTSSIVNPMGFSTPALLSLALSLSSFPNAIALMFNPSESKVFSSSASTTLLCLFVEYLILLPLFNTRHRRPSSSSQSLG